MKNIAFIGLGTMGFPIASHLVKQNQKITIYNRNIKKCHNFKKNFKKYNIIIEDNLFSLAKNNQYIFSCVGNDDDLREIYFSKTGIINEIKPNSYIIDHTTVSSEISIESFIKFKKKNCFFIDAPVSGGEIGAKNGTLSIMVGGDKKIYSKLRKLLDIYSKSITYMGKSGNGQLTKMVNQICVAGIIQGLSEGLNFAKQKKLSFNELFDAVSNGAAQSWQMDNRASTMWLDKFKFGFMNKWMKKDLIIALKEAKKSDILLPCTEEILKFYEQLIFKGYGDFDTSSLIKLLNKKN